MPGQTEDIAAIKRLDDDWHDGWAAGDAEAILALYADNPVLMPQGQPTVTGKDTLGPMYRSVFEEYTIQGDGQVLQVEAFGDWGFLWSTYTLAATPKAGGQPITDEGKSVFIVKRQPGGQWKITHLISNSDRSPASNPDPP
ncbi:MAG: YybH family protein [Pirellulales bacterium]